MKLRKETLHKLDTLENHTPDTQIVKDTRGLMTYYDVQDTNYIGSMKANKLNDMLFKTVCNFLKGSTIRITRKPRAGERPSRGHWREVLFDKAQYFDLYVYKKSAYELGEDERYLEYKAENGNS